MSKIALITDIHLGARRHSPHFVHLAERFFKEQFFPYLEQHNIDTVIDGGDAFDNRTLTNLYVISKAKEIFFNELERRGIKLHKIIGNHECYYENTNKLNTPIEFLSDYENVTIYTDPAYVELYGKRFLMLPWINRENYDISMSHVRENYANYVIGHLPLNGFVMQGARVCDNGINPKEFELYDIVVSGHFHKRSRKDNIHYIGNPFWLKWDEYGDSRGFAVLDTETSTIEYIDNNDQIFHIIEYDSKLIDNSTFEYEKYENKIVKVDVISKGNETNFEEFINRLREVNPLSLTNEFRSIVHSRRSTTNNNKEELEKEVVDVIDSDIVKDTYYHIMKSVDESSDISNKDEIKNLMTEIYNLSHDSFQKTTI